MAALGIEFGECAERCAYHAVCLIGSQAFLNDGNVFFVAGFAEGSDGSGANGRFRVTFGNFCNRRERCGVCRMIWLRAF